MKKNDTTRVQMELPDASFERLKKLKDLTEATSYAEVTKNSFRIYERLIDLYNSGGELFIQDQDGIKKKVEFFI